MHARRLPSQFDESVPFEGAAVEYLREVLRFAGARLNIATVSGGSRDALGTGFRGGVSELSRGLGDVFIGDAWLTEERLRISSFTTPIYIDQLHLWVPFVAEPT